MIALLGISHKSAPVSVRETYSFDAQEIIAFSAKLKSLPHLAGIVIISTCNRTEIYINSTLKKESDVFDFISGELIKFKNKNADISKHFYFKTDGDAIDQLFKVTSGLDSLVIGEEQILGQVKDAFKLAQDNQFTDCITSRLFIKATEAGKRVRTETVLSKGAASISYATVELCTKIFPDLQNRTIMVIGAGQTGELLLQCLMKKKQPAFYLANRTYSTAQEKANKYGATAIKLSAIEEYIPQCDIVITATSSKKHIITKEIVEKTIPLKKNKKQVFIDLSVPSNIDKDIQILDNIHYYAVDSLEAVVNENIERRKSAIDESLKIITEVYDEFMEWLNFQNLTPTINSIRENLKSLHRTELSGFKKYNKIKEHELIDQYSEHISEKYTQMFIKKLKKVTDNGKNTEYIKIINELFEHHEK
jgi:glutamyl-tRNA reductase